MALEHGSKFRKRFGRGIGARAVVASDRTPIDKNRADLIAKCIRCGQSATVRLQGERILSAPRDRVLACKNLGGFAHVHSGDGIGETKLEPDSRLKIGDPEPAESSQAFTGGLGLGELRKLSRGFRSIKERDV